MLHLTWIIPLTAIVIFSFLFLLRLDKKERDSGNIPAYLRNDIKVPDEIKGFNWAAFFLGPIWIIGNKVSLAFLIIYFIPFSGGWIQLAYSFGLGFEANKLAWKSKEWESIDAFMENQKKWNRAALIVMPIAIVLFTAFYFFIFYIEKG